LDSELFGHEKGAFTGAVSQKSGLLEVANRGTIFLDEIGDLDPAIQPKLLKVLEEKRFRRVGSVHDRSVDVHLITATHQDLRAMVAQHTFRGDLYFRICCLPLFIPSLRERPEDIPFIAEHLLERLRDDLGRAGLVFSKDSMAALRSYHWPGNIRELRNVLERAALLSRDDVVAAENITLPLISVPRADPGQANLDITLDELECRHIAGTLDRENGSVERAAARLGIARSTLYAKLKQYRIKIEPGQRSGLPSLSA
jgi:DNA-binding NtrC family response regulator